MMQIINKLKPILTIGDKESDNDDVKRQHGFLIYMGLLMSMGGAVWGTLCILNDIYLAAVVPYTYILITFFNFLFLYKTKNFVFSQRVQILISLLLPFFFQFLLGGFVASGGNVLWSVIAVFGSFTLRAKGASLVWFILFSLLMIFSGLIDDYAKVFDIGLSEGYIVFFFVLNFIAVIAIIFSLYYYFVSSEEDARNELNYSLEQLKKAQEQIVASEKMASLGSLVSGVAHEINTPLGVGLTGVSQITHEIKKIESNYKSEALTEEALLGSVSVIKQLAETIRDRLDNAASLVKSFKSISIDQHYEDKREFMLKKYIADLITSLQSPIKSKKVKVINNLDENLLLESYPGIYSQIISNLILNSILHGFEENTENQIEIESKRIDGKLILNYRDNGKGITDEIESKIFDP
ncbi:HAMP domain-containing histidine kinase, partial [Sulfurimonas sp.]|nr:HAMP domain-containing histidine kinase [Sulfurimonas sp.]